MGFSTISRRPRARGGLMRPDNASGNKSPYISAVVPQCLFDAAADEAEKRGIALSQVIRESLQARYPMNADRPVLGPAKEEA